MATNIPLNNAAYFICDKCNFKCSKKSNYAKHISTSKHQKNANGIKMVYNDICENANMCKCGKYFSFKSGLYRHKKNCKYKPQSNETTTITDNETLDYKSMFIEMIRENKKMQNLLIDQQKQICDLIPKLGNNNNTNSNNNFNINMFLNEKCKNALSMDEFIDRINISMKNLLFTKDSGLIDGLTNIFVENMNKLSLYERPMHCTDKKRETIYIKNKLEGTHHSQWAKDEENREVDKAIDKVSRKQMQNLKQWTDEHPNFMDCDNLKKEYTKLLISCSKDIEKGKITKKLCEQVYLTEKGKNEKYDYKYDN